MNFDFTKDILPENERVRLRPIEISDWDNLLPVALADNDLLHYSPSQVHSEGLLKKYIATALSDREKEVRYAFSVFDKSAGKYAGSTSFGNIVNKDKRIEIGWTWIGRQFQRTGLNRNMKFLMMQYVFETLEFERLEFRTDERNAASRTAIEKIGGKYEGTLRSHMLMPDGFRRNTACYSILKEEWPALKKQLIRTDTSHSLGIL
ncbi:MAG TPA: GNAT family protein [Bacteroidia bacterium]|nr:GNAT family protein [Bacteroidia bacterium]